VVWGGVGGWGGVKKYLWKNNENSGPHVLVAILGRYPITPDVGDLTRKLSREH